MTRVAGAVLVVLVMGCAGCMDATRMLWTGATATDWRAEDTYGLVVDDLNVPRSIIVRYGRATVMGCEPRYAVVAVDAAMRPLPPFAAPELESLADLRDVNLSGSDLVALARAKTELLRELEFAPGHRVVRLRTKEREINDRRVFAVAYALPPVLHETVDLGPDSTRQSDAEGMISEIPNVPLDRVLVVPAEIPRTRLERGKSIVGATLLTPVAIAADLTVVPLLYLGMALTGEWL